MSIIENEDRHLCCSPSIRKGLEETGNLQMRDIAAWPTTGRMEDGMNFPIWISLNYPTK